MKRILVVILSIFLVFSSISSRNIHAEQKDDLSLEYLNSLSGQECLNILEDNGLKIPDGYDDRKIVEDSVKHVIEFFYYNGITNAVPFNYTGLVELSDRIALIIKDSNLAYMTASYSLVNSTRIGSWQNSYNNYNCYAYSINKTTQAFNPGYYCGRAFSMSLSISTMADIVVDDLEALGYTAYMTTTKPTGLSNFQKIICIRKANDNTDYHFMKGDTGLVTWKHKPGRTNPLLWNYSSPTYCTWTNEYSINNIAHPGTITYNSSVYYIIYWLSSIGASIEEDI